MKDLTIEVTGACSLRCIQCSTQAELESYGQLSRRKINDFIDFFTDFEKVRYSGGEPFMRQGIINLAKDAKKRGRFVEILSSGNYWLKPIPEKLLSKGKNVIDRVVFSVYGEGDLHNSICGEYGAFENMHLSVLRTMIDEIPLSFNFVVMKDSLAGLEGAIKYVARRSSEANYCKPSLNLLRFVRQGHGEERQDQALNDSQLAIVVEKAKEFADKYGTRITIGCSIEGQGCTAGTGKAVITSAGNYIPCSALKHTISESVLACRERL